MRWIHALTDPSTRVGSAFDRLIYVLIILSLITFAVETLPEADRYHIWLLWSERVVVTIFTIEYALRFVGRGFSYICSFLGVIDLLAILPFYISFGAVDFRSIRMFRLLRLMRLAKLHRYGSAWQRLRTAFATIKDELVVYCGMTVALLYLSSVGIYYCENEAQPEAFRSVFHSMWWAVCTLTTVGYGDVYPVTIAGRLFTFVILVLGLSVVAVPSGLIASALTRESSRTDKDDPPNSG